MNKGIKLATGELIGILNSDDYYEANAVESMVKSLKSDKYQILYGYVRILKNDEEYETTRLSHKFLNERMIGHPACFVTKNVYDDFGYFDLEYISVADYDFMLRMSKNKEILFVPVDAVIANFVLGGMSASVDAWLDLLKLQRNYGMITLNKYNTLIFKDKICRQVQKLRKHI